MNETRVMLVGSTDVDTLRILRAFENRGVHVTVGAVPNRAPPAPDVPIMTCEDLRAIEAAKAKRLRRAAKRQR